MVVLRRVFRCKYGTAGEVAELCRQVDGKLGKYGFGAGRVLTDLSGESHVVVWETPFASLKALEEARRRVLASPEWEAWNAAAAPMIKSAARDFWKVEE